MQRLHFSSQFCGNAVKTGSEGEREPEKIPFSHLFSHMDLRTRVKLGLLERKTFHGGLYMSVVKPDGAKVIEQMVR